MNLPPTSGLCVVIMWLGDSYMRVTIIGAGTMGGALTKLLSPTHTVTLYDRKSKKCTLKEAVTGAEILFLAVKPQNIDELAKELSPLLPNRALVVSLLAGTPLKRLKTYFPSATLIRIMPNLAIIHGKGVVAVTTEEMVDRNEWTTLLQPLGKIVYITEEQMDAFTSLASSGPAFFLALLEAMVQAGVTMGFKEEESHQIVEHVVEGALELLKKSDLSEAELIAKIASPGGTTLAGLAVMEQEKVAESILNIFLAAKARATELQKT